jgi:hypothetical protein
MNSVEPSSPVPTEKRLARSVEGPISRPKVGGSACAEASAEADAGAERLERPISIGTKAFGRRSACADRKTFICVGGGRRLARSAVEGRFQSAQKAFGQRSACAPNEFGLEGPSAGGRPAPTEKEVLRR